MSWGRVSNTSLPVLALHHIIRIERTRRIIRYRVITTGRHMPSSKVAAQRRKGLQRDLNLTPVSAVCAMELQLRPFDALEPRGRVRTKIRNSRFFLGKARDFPRMRQPSGAVLVLCKSSTGRGFGGGKRSPRYPKGP
ncbi:hypothetical protein CYMTET_46199, partial [Cymbomonas tetramitiformis]